MSSNSNAVVPYSRYNALRSQGRVTFLKGVPIIGLFVFAWAGNKALDESWEYAKRRYKDKEPTDPDYKQMWTETQAELREEKARNEECRKQLVDTTTRVQHFEREEQRTIFAIKWPWS